MTMVNDEKSDFRDVLENISQNLDELISNEYGELSQRWEKLNDAFEAEFNRNATFRGVNEYNASVDIASRLLPPSIVLYVLGFNSSCVLELYALLERLAIQTSTVTLAKDSPKREIIDRLLRRKSLNDIKRILVQLGIWNKDDSRFLNEFTKKRDGTAHKNPEEIIKGDPMESKLYLLDMNVTVTESDTLNYIVKSIRLLMKLFYSEPDR